MKPIVNLGDLKFKTESHGEFEQHYAQISDAIGAKRLGYNLTILPPGKKACPFHHHRVEEEMFLILEGTGILRYGENEYPVRAKDVIAAPAGDEKTAHQLRNDGKTDLVYLALSTRDPVDVCEYPDSQKIAVFGNGPKRNLRTTPQLDYYDGEN